MNTLVPAPLLVRPSAGVLMHSVFEANPDVSASYSPDLPEVFCHALGVCRESQRAITVAEVAARTGHSAAVIGVVLSELAELDLVRSVCAPARAERLRTWAALERQVPVAVAVVKLLVVGTDREQAHLALASLAQEGPWRLQNDPCVEVATRRIAPDLDMLALGVSGLGSGSSVWSDACREAFGAVVITGPSPKELTSTRESLSTLRAAGVPVVVLIHHDAEGEVDTDMVRACMGLPDHTPVVIGDVYRRGVCEALMDLCSTLMNGGRR
ncbi:hypothetical protein [Nocardiopsis sp. NPDC006832]|uniref:hypothetical protein n=1 Tax=Nocardiopsis sp. NPDC006832 TaxID=3157188 RepID=UPI0033FF5F80